MNKRQKGLYTVEFAIVAMLMLILLFGVVEFGRALFVWNSLAELTRKGVRVAVVCPVNDQAIKNIAVFNDNTTPGASRLIVGLSSANVEVDYLDAASNPLICDGCNCDDSCGDDAFTDIRYVQVRISGYQHNLLLPPPLNATITVPDTLFESTLPRESLGVVPGVGTLCSFG